VHRTIDVPGNIDQATLAQLFGVNSSYPRRVFEETGAVVTVPVVPGLSSTAMTHVSVTGDSATIVDNGLSRLRSLFRQDLNSLQGVVRKFTSRAETEHLAQAKLDRPETRAIQFGVVDDSRTEKYVTVPENMIAHMMTPKIKEAIHQVTGVEADFDPPAVRLVGSAEKVARTEKLLARATKLCKWGASEAKVLATLTTPSTGSGETLTDKVRLILSPMGFLKPFEAAFDAMGAKSISIGKGSENDVVVPDELVSRKHCALEFHRGGVYVADHSTNGTFLNGKRLPQKKGSKGKVLVMHGDELLLKNPERGDQEFGYIVNLKQVY